MKTHHSGKRTPKRLPTTLTPDEVAALLATVRTNSTTGLRNRCMLQVMLGAGLRVSELCALRGLDVDLQEATVTVRQGKGSKDRVIPVDHDTLQWLQVWSAKRRDLGLNGKAAYFVGLREGATGRGDREHAEGLKPRYVQALVHTLATAAGIEKRITPHTLRHTYATNTLRREGATVEHVRRLLGHANLATTQVYVHLDDADLKALIQREPEPDAAPVIDPKVQALAAALGSLTEEQRHALAAILGTAPAG